METLDKISAQYEANKVTGRSQFCPRKGYFKILTTYQGFWQNKPALMAKANWKLDFTDSYSSQIFEIQLGSLVNNSSKEQSNILLNENLESKEFHISNALCHLNPYKFEIEWSFLPRPTLSLEEINKIFRDNIQNIDLDQLDDFDLDEDFGDDELNDFQEY